MRLGTPAAKGKRRFKMGRKCLCSTHGESASIHNIVGKCILSMTTKFPSLILLFLFLSLTMAFLPSIRHGKRGLLQEVFTGI